VRSASIMEFSAAIYLLSSTVLSLQYCLRARIAVRIAIVKFP
jgi:hypothetical protein